MYGYFLLCVPVSGKKDVHTVFYPHLFSWESILHVYGNSILLSTMCKLCNYAPSRPIFKRKKNKHNLHTPWNPYYILFIFWRLNLNILTWTFCRIYCFMRYLKGIQCHLTTGFCGLSTYFTIHAYTVKPVLRGHLWDQLKVTL